MITTNLETLKLNSAEFAGTDLELQNLIEALENELQSHAIKGVGLSAIQIGIPQRVAIIRYKKQIKTKGEKRYIEIKRNLWNPIILDKQQPFIYKQEGCLSCPNVFVDTERYNWIKIKNGDGKEETYSGFDAVVIQHEIDHMNGFLITDREV